MAAKYEWEVVLHEAVASQDKEGQPRATLTVSDGASEDRILVSHEMYEKVVAEGLTGGVAVVLSGPLTWEVVARQWKSREGDSGAMNDKAVRLRVTGIKKAVTK